MPERSALAGYGAQYDTALSPQQEKLFQIWRAKLPRELQNESDYDLRGAFLASAKTDGRLHMTDRFKKPNHMTFSDGSQYSNPQMQGGRWLESGIPNPSTPGQSAFAFWASPQNLREHSASALGGYFNEYEQGNVPVLPISYQLPRGR